MNQVGAEDWVIHLKKMIKFTLEKLLLLDKSKKLRLIMQLRKMLLKRLKLL
jgi:hypothetical protein